MAKDKVIEITCTPIQKCAGNDVDKITVYPDQMNGQEPEVVADKYRKDFEGDEPIRVGDSVLRPFKYRNIRVLVKDRNDERDSRPRRTGG